MKNKRKIITMLGLPFCFFAFILILDPLAIFHQFGYKMNWFGLGMRFHAVSAIKSGEYDSFILGTSMLENTSARKLEKIFEGNRFANISLAGGSFFERSILLQFILKDKKVKNIIYSLDASSYIGRTMDHHSFPHENFSFLYNKNPFDDINIYFNWSVVKSVMGFILKDLPSKNQVHERYIDFNRPQAWMYNKENMSRFGGLNSWFSKKNNHQIKQAFRSILSTLSAIASGEINQKTPEEELYDIADAIKYCEYYIISFVKENPSVNFYLIFPPYSRIAFALFHQHSLTSAKIHEAVVRYFASMTKELDNLFVYGFEDQPFLDQIEFYKDTSHYHPDINQKINLCLKTTESRLTFDNVEQYLRHSREAALKFDLIGLGHQIEKYLNKK